MADSYERYLYAGASDHALGLVNVPYKYVSVDYTGTATEIYTFREGNSSGSAIVRTLEVTYTAADKANLDYAVRLS